MKGITQSIARSVLGISLVFLMTALIMHGSLLYFLKKSQAYAISKVVGEHVLLGDKREILAVLNQATSFGFKSISVQPKDGNNLIIGEKEISPSYKRIQNRIFFDAKLKYEAGKIVFYYDLFEGYQFIFLVWILITFLSVLPIKIRAEKQILRRDQETESRKNNAVLQIVNSLAHDLKAPLGAFERMLAMPDEQTIGHEKANIRQSLYRIFTMIEALRRSDLEMVMNPMPAFVEMNSGIDTLIFKAQEKGIRLSFSGEPRVLVNIDVFKFERAWINLVMNAIDFAKSEVKISLHICDHDLVLRVSDDGMGVSPRLLPHLFQRGATYGKADGTGLGLAYVRHVMHAHGGEVTYRRENDHTIFECRLPGIIEHGQRKGLESKDLEKKQSQKPILKVTICIKSPQLSRSILEKLASYKPNNIVFSEERKDAQIVVSDDPSIMIEVLERDDQEYVSVSQMKGDFEKIVSLLIRKFELNQGESSHV